MALVTADSPHSVRASSELLASAIERRGLKVFATIDHGAGAREVGLELAEEVVVSFGDPKVGTLLMQEDARIGYELPLRVLIRDDGGQTVLAYRPPDELADEYAVAAHAAVLRGMSGLLEELLAEIAAP